MSGPRRPGDLDAAAIVRILANHGVLFVVIGAYAAIAQQAPIPATRDIDLTPEAGAENLSRLSAALTDLDARIRTDAEPAGLAFNHDASSLAANAVWNLTSRHGELDIAFTPSDIPGGYAELAPRAHLVVVAEVEVMVADLDDIIRSKEAAGRSKDIRVLPALYRHRDARRDSRERHV